MRVARMKELGEGYYHVLSRIVDRRMVLDDKEKERFRQLMRRAATFSGINILTYTILDNHFHMLVHVPQPSAVDDAELLQRLSALYGRSFSREFNRQITGLVQTGQSMSGTGL